MNNKQALEVLNCNYKVINGSFLYSLYEENLFCKDAFWKFYDSIVVLSNRNFDKKSEQEVTMQISICYNFVLKVFIYHFDRNDLCTIENFPENYVEYIERLDDAINAFFTGVSIDETFFSLQREE